VRFWAISSPESGVRPLDFYLDGHRRSISAKISSAHRTESAMALTVAGTRFPPSHCASFLAAKIDAAISSTRFRPSSILGGTGAEPHATIALGYQLESTTFAFISPRVGTAYLRVLDDRSGGAGIRTLGCAKIRWANFSGEDGTWGGWGRRPLATGDCGCTVAEAPQKRSKRLHKPNRSLDAKSQFLQQEWKNGNPTRAF
jgi:hypothetical protein